MSFRILLLLGLLTMTTVSCISTKRLTYLQENDQAADSLMTLQRVEKPYRVQTNDLLSIRVKAIDQELVGMFNPINDANANATGEERLYYDGFLVDDHGNIRVPTLGEMNVLGYTLKEIRKMIEAELLENYFKKEANIFVTVKLAGIRYTTIGEIGSGSQIIYKDQVSIMEAIANAGDISDVGDRTDVVILRQTPAGQKVHHIDLTQIAAVNSLYYYIQPNDLIIVRPLPQKSLGFGTNGLETFAAISSGIALFTSLIILATKL